MLRYDSTGRIIVPDVSLEQAAASANAAGYNGDALLQRAGTYNGIGDATIDLNGYNGTEESIAGNKGVQNSQGSQSSGYSQYSKSTTVTTQPSGPYVSNQNAQAQVKAGLNNTPDYSLNYQPTEAGKAYAAAMDRIADDLGNKPEYSGKWDPELERSYNAIVNRDPFSWSAEEDPFYKQYEQRYTQLGQQAMKDTMGQAAALTGGYGNTYAQYAGQSAYNAYMDALADKSIELEDRAYQRWIDAGNQLLQNYNLTKDMRDTDYAKYRDDVSDYNYNLALAQAFEADNYARAQYDNDLRVLAEQTGYDRSRQALQDLRYEDELNYARWRDQISDTRYETEWQHQLDREAIEDARYEDELAYARAQDALAAAGGSSGGSSGGGRSGGGSGGGSVSGSSAPSWWNSMSTEERKALQREIGTDADGIWGPNTAAAYNAVYGNYSYNGYSSGDYMPSGDNGYLYSLDGYTGDKIYASVLEEAAQAKYQQDLIDQYVKAR